MAGPGAVLRAHPAKPHRLPEHPPQRAEQAVRRRRRESREPGPEGGDVWSRHCSRGPKGVDRAQLPRNRVQRAPLRGAALRQVERRRVTAAGFWSAATRPAGEGRDHHDQRLLCHDHASSSSFVFIAFLNWHSRSICQASLSEIYAGCSNDVAMSGSFSSSAESAGQSSTFTLSKETWKFTCVSCRAIYDHAVSCCSVCYRHKYERMHTSPEIRAAARSRACHESE